MDLTLKKKAGKRETEFNKIDFYVFFNDNRTKDKSNETDLNKVSRHLVGNREN